MSIECREQLNIKSSSSIAQPPLLLHLRNMVQSKKAKAGWVMAEVSAINSYQKSRWEAIIIRQTTKAIVNPFLLQSSKGDELTYGTESFERNLRYSPNEVGEF